MSVEKNSISYMQGIIVLLKMVRPNNAVATDNRTRPLAGEPRGSLSCFFLDENNIAVYIL